MYYAGSSTVSVVASYVKYIGGYTCHKVQVPVHVRARDAHNLLKIWSFRV